MNTEPDERADMARVVALRVRDYTADHSLAALSLAHFDQIASDELDDPAQTAALLRAWGAHCELCELFFEASARSLEIWSLAYMGDQDKPAEWVPNEVLMERLETAGRESVHHGAALADFAGTVLMVGCEEERVALLALTSALAVIRQRPALAKTFGRLIMATLTYPGTISRRSRVAPSRSALSAQIAAWVPDWARFHDCIAYLCEFDRLLGDAARAGPDLQQTVDGTLRWLAGDPDLSACSTVDPACDLRHCLDMLLDLTGDTAVLIGDPAGACDVYRLMRPSDQTGLAALQALR